jgi:hypothetical protein
MGGGVSKSADEAGAQSSITGNPEVDARIRDATRRGITLEPNTLEIPPGSNICVYVVGVPGSGTEVIAHALKKYIKDARIVQSMSIKELSAFQFGGNTQTPTGNLRPVEYVNLFDPRNIRNLPDVLSTHIASEMLRLRSDRQKNLMTATVFLENPRMVDIVLSETLFSMGYINEADHATLQRVHRIDAYTMSTLCPNDSTLFIVLDTPIDVCQKELERTLLHPEDGSAPYTHAYEFFTQKECEFLVTMRKHMLQYFEESLAITTQAQIIYQTTHPYASYSNCRYFVLSDTLKFLKTMSENIQHRLAKSPLYHQFKHLEHIVPIDTPENALTLHPDIVKGAIDTYRRRPYKDPSEKDDFLNQVDQTNGYNIVGPSNALDSSTAMDILLSLQKQLGQVQEKQERTSEDVDTLKRLTHMRTATLRDHYQPQSHDAPDLDLPLEPTLPTLAHARALSLSTPNLHLDNDFFYPSPGLDPNSPLTSPRTTSPSFAHPTPSPLASNVSHSPITLVANEDDDEDVLHV